MPDQPGKNQQQQSAANTDTSGKSGEIDTAVSQAKAAHAADDEKKCIEITSKALQDLQNLEKGGNP